MCRELLEGVLASDDRSNAYNPQRWRRLADLCIQQGRVAEAQLCAQSAGDLSLSLLLLSCIGDKTGLYEVAKQAQQQDQLNIAFLALYIAGDAEACLKLLQDCGKLPEAAFFSLSHLPSFVNDALQAWQEDLRSHKHIAAELLANPKDFGSYSPGLEAAQELEKALEPLHHMNVAACEYPKYCAMLEGEGLDLSQLRTVEQVMSEVAEEVSGDAAEEVEGETTEGDVPEEERAHETVVETTEESVAQRTESGHTPDSDFDELMDGDVDLEGDGDDLDLDDLEKEWN